MPLTRIVINTPDSATSVANHLNPQATSKMQSKLNLANWFSGMSMGTYPDATEVQLATGAVKASGTGTFTGAATAAQTMEIAGVTFTASDDPDEEDNEFLSAAGSVTLGAASLANAINNSSDLTGIVTAESNLGVVTITAYVPGAIGNAIATNDVDTSNFTFAQTHLASGVNGTVVTF